MSFEIKDNLDDVLAEFDGFADAVEAAARPTAQAGAQVLYEAVLANVSKIKAKTGKLAASIYQAYSKDKSYPGHAEYHVSWNARKAPHGHLVEFGHVQKYMVVLNPKTGRFRTLKDKPLSTPKQVAAQPFVRPARSKFPEAAAAMRTRLVAELAKRGNA